MFGTDSDDVLRSSEGRLTVDCVTRLQRLHLTHLSDEYEPHLPLQPFRAKRVIDRFHVQKQALEAVQEATYAHRWDAINADTETTRAGLNFQQTRCADTPHPTVTHSKSCLHEVDTHCSSLLKKWTDSQRQRIDLMFSLYPDLQKEAYWNSLNISGPSSPIRGQPLIPARLNLARWYNRVAESGSGRSTLLRLHSTSTPDEIINYFDNRSTNASAESIQLKIKGLPGYQIVHRCQRYKILQLPTLQSLCLNTAFYHAP